MSEIAHGVSTGRDWSAATNPGYQAPADVPHGINRAGKRILDLVIAIPLLVFISPLMLAIWCLNHLLQDGSALFRQQRYGRGGQTFSCYKFTTMFPNAAELLENLLQSSPEAAAEWASDQKLRNDPRVTPFGKFLRKSSLDELPQLINIIKGDMSIVGPRPIVHNEIAKYGPLFDYYAATRPGVTGLWQVSGRNHVSYDARVELDARYVREWSLLGDIVIILKTIPAIIAAHGAF